MERQQLFYQPTLENILASKVDDLPNVTVLRGWDAQECNQFDDHVEVRIASKSHNDRRAIHARYLLGADGANSKVREWIGTEMHDLGYFHDWLVVDLQPHAPMNFSPPAWQLCDPARPTSVVPAGPGRRRFEFMKLDDETTEELSSATKVWELLAPWGITPDTAVVERSAVYTFQARWCRRWRSGRLFLAGDSAHLMPPSPGRGCARACATR